MNEMELKLFADKVKKFRKDKLITQEEFAYECGLTQQTISHVETGKYLPTLLTIRKILNVIEKE